MPKKPWMGLEVKAEGKTSEDLAIALEEIIRKVREGYLSGQDKNETGAYRFEVEEELQKRRLS